MILVEFLLSALLGQIQQEAELLIEVLVLLKPDFLVVFSYLMQNGDVIVSLIEVIILLYLVNQDTVEDLLLVEF